MTSDSTLKLAGMEIRRCRDGDFEIIITNDVATEDTYAFITTRQARFLRDWLTGRLARRTTNSTGPEWDAGEGASHA